MENRGGEAAFHGEGRASTKLCVGEDATVMGVAEAHAQAEGGRTPGVARQAVVQMGVHKHPCAPLREAWLYAEDNASGSTSGFEGGKTWG